MLVGSQFGPDQGPDITGAEGQGAGVADPVPDTSGEAPGGGPVFGPDQGPDQTGAEGQGFGGDDVLLGFIAYPDINSWIRFILTGDDTSATPTDAQLLMVTSDIVDQMLQSFPCTSDGAGAIGVTGADLRAFNKAAGYAVAAEYVQTPAGRQFAGNVISTKIGPVTRTRKEITISDVVDYALLEMRKALARISCIRAARADDPAAQLMGTIRVTPDRERPITLPLQDRWW